MSGCVEGARPTPRGTTKDAGRGPQPQPAPEPQPQPKPLQAAATAMGRKRRARAARSTRVGSGAPAYTAVSSHREDTETLALRREGQQLRAELAAQRAQLAARKQASLPISAPISAHCAVFYCDD